MLDILLTFSLVLSLAGLSIAMSALSGNHAHDGCIPHEQKHISANAEVYAQNLVATYLGYRQ